MPFVLRDENKKIIRATVRPIVNAEFLPHEHPEITAFLKDRGQNPDQVEEIITQLRQSDAEMARTVEDVILVLLKKNILKMSDLPKVTQERMAARVRMRVMIEDIYDQASGTKR